MNNNVLVIAEAGVNHNGDLDLAKLLVRAAADSGADIVKFQTFNTDQLISKNTSKTNYQLLNTDNSETLYQMLKNLELSNNDYLEINKECKLHNIEFLSSAFDQESIHYLIKLGIKRIKIPSGELNNLPYLREVSKFKLPIILSTGMSTSDEIKQALEILNNNGIKNKLITVLHCNTEYPSPMKDINLLAMKTMKEMFNVEIGYSDHTIGKEVSIAAVALGAKIIEKHLTLDREMTGPDHVASLEPYEFKEMVKAIRNIEDAISGDKIKKPSQSEINNISLVRRSIVATKEIKKGDSFTIDNIGLKRPATGISPMKWDTVIGEVAKKDFKIDDLIVI